MAQTKALEEKSPEKAPGKKTDWVTPVAVVGGAGILFVGLWLYFRKTAGGSITDIWVNKGSFSKQAIPFTTNADSQTFEVGVSYKNTGKEAVVLGAEVIITKPNGEKVQPTVDMAGADVGEVLSKEYNISKVDQVGEWGIDINIITEKGDVLDTFTGVALDVVEEVEEGDWGQAGVILAKADFETEIGPSEPGDWLPANVELGRVEFTVIVEAAGPSDWLPANAELDRKSFSVLITAAGGGKQPPEIDTLPAENITYNSVTLTMELTDEGFCSGAYCYIEYGKTTSYGKKTSTVRLQPGWDESFDLEGLEANTKYYFRAVAEGRCVSPYLIGYGLRRNFTTKTAELVEVSIWDYKKNGHFYDEPQLIYIGDEVGVQIIAENTSDEAFDIWVQLTIYSRGYTSSGRKASGVGPTDLEPGESLGTHIEYVADVVSDWTCRIQVEVDGVNVYDREILIGWGVA